MEDSLFLLLALAFLGAMLFYSSRKRKKQAEELRAKLVKGAYVMLTSGIFGKLTAVMDDRVELEISPGQKMTVAIGAVRSIEEEPTKTLKKELPKSEAKAPTKAQPKSEPKKK